MRSTHNEPHDMTTEQALRQVYNEVWNKNTERHRFFKTVAVTVPANGQTFEYSATFLRIGSIKYFTQLVRGEHNTVLDAIGNAMARYTLPDSSPSLALGSSIIFGQTGVGKSTCLRLALVDRLLRGERTVYLDEAAHVLAVYTASGCRVFRTIDPDDGIRDLEECTAWSTLFDWSERALNDPVASDILRGNRLTTVAFIDSDPARPRPPLWLADGSRMWVAVQGTSTPPLDVTNSSWTSEHNADRIWMDSWSWPEVFAACLYLYGFDTERMSRAREVFFSATPTLEHCVEFSQSPATVAGLCSTVTDLAQSYVSTTRGLWLARTLGFRASDSREVIPTSDLHVEQFPVDRASTSCSSVHVTWLYGVLDPNSHDNHRGRASSTVTTRVVRPYIIFPRPSERVGCNYGMRSQARLEAAGDIARSIMRAAVTAGDHGSPYVKILPTVRDAQVKIALTVDNKCLRMVTEFKYNDDNSVSETGKLCIETALHYAKGPGVPPIDKLIATALVPTDEDSKTVQTLKMEWIGILERHGFRLVKSLDPMEVDAIAIVQYEKAIG